MLLTPVLEAVLVLVAFFFIALVVQVILRRSRSSVSDAWRACIDVVETPLALVFLFTGTYVALDLFALGWIDRWIGVGYFVFMAVVIAYFLDRVSSILIRRWLRRQEIYEKTPELINKAISIVIYIVVLLIVLDQYNIEISPFIATLGIGGVAVGLALQDTLKDFFAGVHIISDRFVRVGDYVEVGEHEGFVTDIGWRSTRIKTILGNHVVIPNSKLATSTVQNNSMPDGHMKIRVRGGVDYESDLDKVEDVVYDVADDVQEEVDGAVADREPFVRFLEFGDSNIIFRAVLHVSQYVRKYKVESEFIKRLHKRFDEEGIEISWPVRKLYDMQDAAS